MEIFVLLGVAGVGLLVAGTIALVYTMQHPHRRTLAYALAKGLPCDPSDLGLGYEEMTFRFSDGTRSPGWIIPGRNPDGPVVLITHGWTSSKYHALTRVPFVVDHASRMVVYDMRGHGESTAKTCRLGQKEPGDILSILDQVAVHTRDSSSPLLLVGISMGAGITIHAGGMDSSVRERVIGVIVEGPYRWPMEPVVGHLRCRGWPPYPLVWMAGGYLRLTMKGYDQFDRVIHAGRLKSPLMVMHGTADLICPVESGRAIAGGNPRGRFVPFEGAGHSDLAEDDEALFRREYDQFIESVCRSSIRGSVKGE